MNFNRLIHRLINELRDNGREHEDGVTELEGFFKRELRGTRKPEDRVSELQSAYNELSIKREQGLPGSGIDEMKMNTVKAELEQAIADLILQNHKTN